METDLMQSVWQEIRAHLEHSKREIYAEITSYPPPIPACDVQFNYLLEQRSKVNLELQRLDAASDELSSSAALIDWIDGFISESSFIDDETAQRLRVRLMQKWPEVQSQ